MCQKLPCFVLLEVCSTKHIHVFDCHTISFSIPAIISNAYSTTSLNKCCYNSQCQHNFSHVRAQRYLLITFMCCFCLFENLMNNWPTTKVCFLGSTSLTKLGLFLSLQFVQSFKWVWQVVDMWTCIICAINCREVELEWTCTSRVKCKAPWTVPRTGYRPL